MLQSNLDIEYAVDAKPKTAIALCESAIDFVTRNILVVLFDDTESDQAHFWSSSSG
ncbi:hypothetical protein MIH18_02420 [Marinobacter sp. M3C]|jgi:bacterioferritin|uniref:hypothetical protein n=1 Tax=Marinobacter sp. M3C TaxID=2917715 RepID=UPI00200F8B05|nr:hypothetical protein [Marinobacter sp. M3C]UQG60831.1 hypothetical protein MIH18_02420 [Marinobacter sp. M3C]